MRITIGGKVFGIVLLLIVLMGVTAAISSYLVRDAAFALSRVNQTYTPLSRAIAEVGIHQLEQELMALELFDDLSRPEIGQAAIDRRLAEFEDRVGKVEAALAAPTRLLRRQAPIRVIRIIWRTWCAWTR